MENHVCLSRGVQVACATRLAATRIVAGVGDLVQRTGDSQARVGYSVAGRSRDRLTPCTICTVHVETRSAGFFIEPQNQGWISWLSLKTKVRFLGLASKPRSMVSQGLASKPVATVLMF
jgi:hypothetical protein